jgi:hypothetical protein
MCPAGRRRWGTFVRFSQYAYTGDYIAADPDILPDSSTTTSTHLVPNEVSNAQPEPEPELEPVRDLSGFDISNDGWGFSKNDKKKAKAWSKKSELWGKFQEQSICHLEACFSASEKPRFMRRLH